MGRKRPALKSKTPQPSKMKKGKQRLLTPKSEPPPKRKKLREELEDEMSDEEFDTQLLTVKTKEFDKKLKGTLTPNPKKGNSEDEDNESDEEDYYDDIDNEEDDDNEVEEEIKEAIKVKYAQKRKSSETKPVKESKKLNLSGIADDDFLVDKKAKADLNSRTLYVRNLPDSITVSQIKAWSPAIQDVILRRSAKKNIKSKQYAYLEFNNEQDAEEHFKSLAGKNVDGKVAFVDYVGVKAKGKTEIKKPVFTADITEVEKKTTGKNLKQTPSGKHTLNVGSTKKTDSQTPPSTEKVNSKDTPKSSGKQKETDKVLTFLTKKVKVVEKESDEDDDDDESDDDEKDDESDEDDKEDDESDEDDEEDGESDDADEEEDESDVDVDEDDEDDDADDVDSNDDRVEKSKGIAGGCLLVDKKSKEELHSRTLYVRNLPDGTTVSQIKAWSPAIQDVKLRCAKLKHPNHKQYAFLEFKLEKEANENFKLLAGKTLDGKMVFVDYVGAKAKGNWKNWKAQVQAVADAKKKTAQKAAPKKPELAAENRDLLRLCIRGFHKCMTMREMEKLFPTAMLVELPLRVKDKKPIGFGFASYEDKAMCEAAHDKMQGVQHLGKDLLVQYAKKAGAVQQTKKRKNTTESQKKVEPDIKKSKMTEVEKSKVAETVPKQAIMDVDDNDVDESAEDESDEEDDDIEAGEDEDDDLDDESD